MRGPEVSTTTQACGRGGENGAGGGTAQAAPACPLCERRRNQLIATIPYEDIRFVYRRLLKLEIAAERCSSVQYLRCLECDLRFFSPQVCGEPAFYERLQAFPWYYLAEKTEYVLASRLIPEGSSVLEVGCGAGAFAAFLPERCRYRGLEYNGEAVRRARECGLQVERASIEEFSKSSPSRYDAVCAFQVLEHVASPRSLLTAAAQLLRPGGLLIIAVPSEDSFMADEVNNVLNMPPHHVTRWTDAALESVGRVTGMPLMSLEHEPVSDLHLRSFAAAHIWSFARDTLGVRVPMVSRKAASPWARGVLRLLSLPLERRARRMEQRPAGHSVVAAYRKG